MDSSYGRLSTYHVFNGDSESHSEDDFLAAIGLYGIFCATIQEDDFLHWHGGRVKKVYGSGGFSNAIQISDAGVTKIPRIFPGSDEFNERRFYRDLITEIRICLWEPIRNHANIISLQDVQWFPGPHPSVAKNWNYMWPTPEFETASGTLTGLLQNCPGLAFMGKMSLLFDVAKALDCLHQYGVIHSDIKPDNIFIFSSSQRNYIAKIADFGCSTILEPEETHGHLSGGTRVWSAPEAGERLSHEELCKTDLYSFGLVVWHVVTDGYGPFRWLESWCDTTPLLMEDISRLKEDNCFLPLSQESLSELHLSEIEMGFTTELLNATLCPNETRAKFLTPFFEKYGYILAFKGEQQDGSPELGDAKFLRPIELVDIRHFIHKVNMDDRLREKIFRTVKDLASPGKSAFNPGSLSWQTFLCYYYGFGTTRDNKAAMSELIRACEFGYTEAQSLVVQFHQAHGAEYPTSLPVVVWLEGRVSRGEVGASKALKSIDSGAYKRSIREAQYNKMSCDGCALPWIPGEDHSCGLPQSAEGTLELVESLFINYNPESEVIIQEIDRELRETTGNSIIHFAAAAGMQSVVQGLIDNNNCEYQVKTRTGLTPLCLACRGGHRGTALLLLSRMPPACSIFPNIPHLPVFEGFCLHDLPSFDPNDTLEVATHAIQKIKGAAKNLMPLSNGSPCDPMVTAILKGSLESTKVLLQLGGRRSVGNMHIAAAVLSGDILDLLMWDFADKGERLNASDLEELYFAASAKSDPLDIIQRHGFEHSYTVIRTFETLDYFTRLWHPDLLSKVQKKAFDTLIRYRRNDIIQLVLDPFFKDFLYPVSDEVYPPLWWPMRMGDMETFSLLLEHGAATCGGIETVFSKSIKISNPFFVKELIRYGYFFDDETLMGAGDMHMDMSDIKYFPSPFESAVIFDCFDTAVYLYRATRRHVVMWGAFVGLLVREGPHSGLCKLDFLLNFIEQEGLQLPPPLNGQNTLHRLQEFWCVEPEERRAEIRRYMINIVRRFPHLVNSPDAILGGTPIFGAAIHHNVLLAEALIESGADLDIKDKLGCTVLEVILMQRLWEVLGSSPNGGPRNTDKKPRDLGLDAWVEHEGDRGVGCGPVDCLASSYRGDSYDKRLDKIYSMIKAAGGSSRIQGASLCFETLEGWTEFWEWRNNGETSGGRCIGEEGFDDFYHFIHIWGPQWHSICSCSPAGEPADSFHCEGLGEEDLDEGGPIRKLVVRSRMVHCNLEMRT